MLDVRRLAILVELSRRGTLAEVAAALHQSPSSVSQQLAALEKEAGTPLLRKVGRGVQLTGEADILVAHATEIIARLEAAESALGAAGDEVVGTVAIAVFQSAALALMPPALATLAHDHPRLRVTMTQREPETALYETWTRAFDLVVAEQYPGHAAPWYGDLDRVALTTDPLRLAVPPRPRDDHDWDAVGSITDAAAVPWVMEPRGAASRHWAEQLCRSAGFEPDVRYETADLQAHLALIEAGHAVALLPDLMAAPRRGLVRLVDLPGDPHREVFTATPASLRGRPSIQACRAALAAAVSPGSSAS